MKNALLVPFLLPFLASAAPFAEWIEVPVPGGSVVRIWGEGDEFDAHFRTEEGRTIVYNGSAGRYEYVRKDAATGALLGTGVFLGDEPGNASLLAALPLGDLYDTSDAHAAATAAKYAAWDEATGVSAGWQRLKEENERRRAAEAAAAASGDGPLRTKETSGTMCGFTLLVDFPMFDEDGVQTNTLATVNGERDKYGPAYVRAMMNQEGWRGDGNIASVRDYYYQMSLGRLVYTNVVTEWVLVPHERSYYDVPTEDDGACGRRLIGDALDVLKETPDFDTAVLPMLQALSLDNGTKGNPLAFNVLFAGGSAANWSYGLWAHSWSLASTQYNKLTWRNPGGTQSHFYNYQITALRSNGNTPVIGTICHEDGHMICRFPDYYQYQKQSFQRVKGEGVGEWSLMCSANHLGSGKKPGACDAYSRFHAGWVEPIDIALDQGWVYVTNSYDSVYRYANPANSKEAFFFENRQADGIDAGLKHGGLLVWRTKWAGNSNTTSANTSPNSLASVFAGLATDALAATNRLDNELSLEQANGSYHLERGSGRSLATDPWYEGNDATATAGILNSGYKGVWNDDTVACARWSDGTPSGLRISHVSECGQVMRFFVGDPSAWPVPFADIRIKSAVGEAATFTAFVESWGTGCSSIDVYAETGSDAAFSTVLSSAKIGTMAQLDSLTEWTVGGLSFGTPHYVRIRLANASGEAVGPVATLDFRLDEDIPPAVDAPEIRFWQKPGNPKNWYVATDKAHKGSTSARSGAVGNNNSTTLNATVDGPGTFTFWWNVSSQGRDSDYLAYTASWDPATTDKIGGTSADWAQVTLEVPAGSQTISWTYRKNASSTGGSDCAWIDDVVWTPDGAAPVLGTVSVSATATSATLSVPVLELGDDAESATVSATIGGATSTASVSAAGGTATLVFDGLSPETVYSWSVVATSVPSGVSSAAATGTFRTGSLPATGWFDVEWTTQGWGSGTSWRTAAGEAAAGGTWSVPEGDASSLDGGVLSLVPPEGGALRFTAVSPSDAGGFVKVEGTLSPVVSASLPEVPTGALAGLGFALGGFKAWNGAEWIPLSGSRPSSAATPWTATFDFRTSPPKVRYVAGGAALSAQGSEWIPLAVPRNFARGVVFSGGGSLGDFEATFSGGRSAPVLATLAEDGVEPLRFGAAPSGSPTFEVTIRNAVAGAWYTVYAADEVGGAYQAAASVQATADGLLTLSIPAPSDKPTRFVRIGVGDAQVPAGTAL